MKYDIHSVIAKPYSIHLSVKERLLKAHALHIIHEPYAMPEKEGVMDKLVFDALEQSRQDGRKY